MTFLTIINTNLPVASNTTLDFLPIILQVAFAIVFVALIIGISAFLGPSRKNEDKLASFTSGIKSHGSARQPLSVHFFLVAILFVLFDVEVVFFYPYAVVFKQMGWVGFIEVLLFVSFFVVGLVYVIKKGALSWED